MSNISMKSLLEAGVHFGHQTSQWNPKMAKYVFGSRNKIHIIDLAKTVKELRKAYKYMRDVASTGAPVLFVGTKHQAQEIVKSEAEKCGAHYVVHRWLGGTLTNFDTIKRNIARLFEIEKMKEDGVFEKISKKEVSMLTKEKKKLDQSLQGIKNMKTLPGVMFVVDPVNEKTAVHEARSLNIPIVAICDTNCDPDEIDYVIPGNDDAIKSVNLIVTVMAEAVMEGKATMKTEKTEGTIEEKYSSEEQISLDETKAVSGQERAGDEMAKGAEGTDANN